jgi:hypothetical protein
MPHGGSTAALACRAGQLAIEDIEKIESISAFFAVARGDADEEEAGFCAPYLIAAV